MLPSMETFLMRTFSELWAGDVQLLLGGLAIATGRRERKSWEGTRERQPPSQTHCARREVAAGLKIQFWRVGKPQRGAGRDVTQKPAREATPPFCGREATSSSSSSSPGLAGPGFAPATASGRDVKSRGSRRRRRSDHVSSRAPGRAGSVVSGVGGAAALGWGGPWIPPEAGLGESP